MNLYKKIKKLEHDTSYVLITIVEAQRSVPQEIGAKMIVTQSCVDSPLYGTIGGGKVEKESVRYALSLLTDPSATSHLKHIHLTKDLHMACGGEMTIFFEVIRSKNWNIAIFGAGHVSQKLIRILKTLDCHIHCFDSRQEWLEKLPKSKNISKYHIGMTPEKIGAFEHLLPKECFYLIMTHSHNLDFPIAKKIITKNNHLPYLGIVGSVSKAKSIGERLLKCDIAKENIKKIYSPVGLPIGNNTPAEIAISISAQLLEVRGSHY
jgi:xanthine dehydrogenase accessory factor